CRNSSPGRSFLSRSVAVMLVDEAQLKTELGHRLRAARSAQGRTLADVAIDAGLSLPYVANLESGRGNPTLGALYALASALGTPLVALLAEATDVSPQPPFPLPLEGVPKGSRFRAGGAPV